VIADIKKTTKKPIKYVLDTHHHGDHAYGNTIWAKEGAQIVAHKNAARLLKTSGPKQWEDAAKDRKDIKDNELKQVDISFDDKYELKDDTQHVVFMHFGHSHTAGDAVAYLPKHKILCTGDACVNGAFNYMGHSNSASWIKCLEAMEKLEIDLICPGHGKPARKDLIAKEKRYFGELRAAVKKGIDDKKSVEEITKGLDFPWYKEWTGVGVAETDMNKGNVKHVYDELMGKIDHDRLGARPDAPEWKPEIGLAGR
jgi:cyclase